MAESKVALVKENGRYVGFYAVTVVDGKPISLGALDEPIEVIECSREQLMDGFIAHPQEYVSIINQNTNYEEEVEEHLRRRERRAINNTCTNVLE